MARITESASPASEPKPAHTPGPWLARDYANQNGDVWIDCDSWKNPKTASCRGGTLATAHKDGAGEGTVEANARLIAAAPDLLAALMVIVKDGAISDWLALNDKQALRQAITAIAKAEGSAR